MSHLTNVLKLVCIACEWRRRAQRFYVISSQFIFSFIGLGMCCLYQLLLHVLSSEVCRLFHWPWHVLPLLTSAACAVIWSLSSLSLALACASSTNFCCMCCRLESESVMRRSLSFNFSLYHICFSLSSNSCRACTKYRIDRCHSPSENEKTKISLRQLSYLQTVWSGDTSAVDPK